MVQPIGSLVHIARGGEREGDVCVCVCESEREVNRPLADKSVALRGAFT